MYIVSSVTAIGGEAFNGCTGLTSITIPDNVTLMGNRAFYDCSRLIIYCEIANKPSSWHSSWNYSNRPVIWDCKNNDKDENGYTHAVIDRIRYSLKDGIATITWQSSNISSNIKIPEIVIYNNATYSVTSIENMAFSGCGGLNDIEIPNSVTSIGFGAFSGCSSLIQTEDGVCYVDKWIIACDSSITISTLRNDTVGIADEAFWGSQLTSVTIPNSVIYIGRSVFYFCRKLSNIIVETGNTKYHSAGNCLIETASKILIAGCSSSKIPNDGSVTTIGENAFAYCYGLTHVEIPSSVTNIGHSAFNSCLNLTSVYLNDGVTSIEDSAFADCDGLKNISIPSSVTSIGSYAFDGIKIVVYKGHNYNGLMYQKSLYGIQLVVII